MRIALTVLTGRGPTDVVVQGEPDTNVGEVAGALATTLRRTGRGAGPDARGPVTATVRTPPGGGSDAPERADEDGDHGRLADVVRHPRAHWTTGAEPPSPSPTAPATPGALWLNGRMLDPAAPAVRELYDGAVVTIDPRGAAATVVTEPVGIVEIRVSGGPAAGAVHRLGLGVTTLGRAATVRLADPSLPDVALAVTVERGRVLVEAPPGVEATLDERPLGAGAADAAPPEPPKPWWRRMGRRLFRGKRRAAAAPPPPADAPRRDEWRPGGVVVVGSTVLTLSHSSAPDAHLSPLDDGGLAYNRPPRLRPPQRPRTLEVPQQPKRDEKQRLRLFGSLLLAVFSVAMAIVLKTWWIALFALSYPLMQVGEWVGDRRHGRKSYKKAMREYRERMAEFEVALDDMRRQDQAERRADVPDPAEVLLTAVGPRRRLWERRITDSDTLDLRVGLADLPAAIELTAEGGGKPPAPPTAHTVPVTLPLPDLGVVGLTGPRDRSRALARWFVAQSAALHSPRDLAIVVLSASDDGAAHWNWVRWLPHTSPRDGAECVAMVGCDPESVGRRVTELASLVAERRQQAAGSGPSLFGAGAAAASGGALFGAADGAAGPVPPYNVLVVLDGARLLRRVPGMPQVLSAGPAAGVYAICLDDDERLLPEECTAVVSWDHDRPTHVRLRGADLDLIGPVLADQVGPVWCDRLARTLAPVRDVSREDADAAIPLSARLLDVLHLPNPRPDDVVARWKAGGRTTRVPIGVAADGVFHVDLRVDGPHALIAGTTGAGKSELLQTLIASLAVANRPDEMTFVLIDYKGGAAFKDCGGLPHTVGMVTDLDGHLTERALESLGAELRRREELLLSAGAKDIEDYCELRDRAAGVEGRGFGRTGRGRAGNGRARSGPGDDADELPPLPRLVLIIDEFAAMVGELPDFVTGLVDIGRRGRSLGVHLILATQRPAGVVTPDIRANTNLRIALRVTDQEESTDVIDAPDAARIAKSTPGRCYVRSGAEPPSLMQSARVGGRRPGTGVPSDRAVEVVPLPWNALGRALPEPDAGDDDPDDMETDLSALVAAITVAAERAGVTSPPSPWLPPLPDEVEMDALPGLPEERHEAAGAAGAREVLGGPPRTFGGAVEAGRGGLEATGSADGAAGDAGDGTAAGTAPSVPPLPFGLGDIPAQQRRATETYDLEHSGHLAVIGAPRSGRSTLLRALAASVGRFTDPRDVHLYGVDCGNNALLPLVALPHCGAVVTRDQPDRLGRLTDRLLGEISRRQQVLAEQGFADVSEQRAGAPPGERLPYLLVLFDRWEGFTAAFSDHDAGKLIDQWMRILQEGAGVGVKVVLAGDRSMLFGRISTLVDDRLLLKLTDPGDYGMIGMTTNDVPEHFPPGRGFRAEGVRECQVALLCADQSGPAQVAALQRIGRRAADAVGRLPARERPFRVDPLPARIGLDEALALASEPMPDDAVFFGVGGDTLDVRYFRALEHGPGILVAGPPKSGRSTVLRTMLTTMLDRGWQAVIITPRRSPLRDMAGRPGVRAVFDQNAELPDVREAISGCADQRHAVVVDDVELLGSDGPLPDYLADYVGELRDTGNLVIAAGTDDDLERMYRGPAATIKRTRIGILLRPSPPSGGELLGIRLPRSAMTGGGPPGHGVHVMGGAWEPFQTAWPG